MERARTEAPPQEGSAAMTPEERAETILNCDCPASGSWYGHSVLCPAPRFESLVEVIRAAEEIERLRNEARGDLDTVLAEIRALAAKRDPLHPTGRCTCVGEGTCAWCVGAAKREGR